MKIPLNRLTRALLVGLGLCSGLNAQTPARLSLEQAVDYALQNSNTVRNAQLEVADAEALIMERRAEGLPQLDANAGFNRYLKVPVQPLPDAFVQLLEAILPPGEEVEREASFFLKNNFTASVNAEAMIFDGSYFAALQAAKAARNYYQLNLQQRQREVRNQVADAYLPTLLIEENIEQIDKNIANLERLLFETRETYLAGFAEQLDVDRLELSLANLRTERDNLERQYDNAVRALKFTINYPIDQPLDVEGDLDSLRLEADADDLTGTITYERRPELTLLQQAVALNELNVRVNRAAYLPTLRATGSYQYQYQGNTLSDGFWAPTAVVGVNLHVPIFNGLATKARIQRAQLDVQEAQNQLNDLQRSIELEVTNARTDYLSARERLESRRRNIVLAERIYETTQIKYREGIGSSLEVTQAEQSLYEAQSNYLQAVYDVLTARTDLEQALGR